MSFHPGARRVLYSRLLGHFRHEVSVAREVRRNPTSATSVLNGDAGGVTFTQPDLHIRRAMLVKLPLHGAS